MSVAVLVEVVEDERSRGRMGGRGGTRLKGRERPPPLRHLLRPALPGAPSRSRRRSVRCLPWERVEVVAVTYAVEGVVDACPPAWGCRFPVPPAGARGAEQQHGVSAAGGRAAAAATAVVVARRTRSHIDKPTRTHAHAPSPSIYFCCCRFGDETKQGGNVLLSKDGGSVKLADFGTSKPMDQDSIVSGIKGTPNWMAPEVIMSQLLPGGWPQADVWSVGCTVVEMLTGRMPWPSMNPMCAMYKIVKGGKPPLNR